jgi:hypothetical protein
VRGGGNRSDGVVALKKTLLPAWLNPWCREDYQIGTPANVADIRAALTRPSPRVRASSSSQGNELTLTLRGRLLFGYVRAVVNVVRRDSSTQLDVSISRRTGIAWIMTAIGVAIVLMPFLELIGWIATNGTSSVWTSAPLISLVVGPLIFAIVMAVNYSQWRTEAKDLKALIGTIVSQRGC